MNDPSLLSYVLMRLRKSFCGLFVVVVVVVVVDTPLQDIRVYFSSV